MIVPNPFVQGGIASVVNGYKGSSLEKEFQITYVESYCDGSKTQKFIKACKGYWVFFMILISKKNKPDIVHIHSSFGPSFYRKMPFILFSYWFRVPIINHIHGADFDTFFIKASNRKRNIIKKIYELCDVFIVLSEQWRLNIAQIVCEDKIYVVENYAILPDIIDRKKQNNQVLFIGELGDRKGCFDIPKIWKLVKESVPDAKLVMAGAGKKEELIETFCKEGFVVDESLSFPGWVRGIEKERVFQESTVLLFPSYNEGMPMAVLEAMAYQLGIVTTNVGGIPKLIESQKSGYLFEPGEIKKMAQAVVCLLENKEQCASYGKNARETVFLHYSLEAHIKKISNLYWSVSTCENQKL